MTTEFLTYKGVNVQFGTTYQVPTPYDKGYLWRLEDSGDQPDRKVYYSEGAAIAAAKDHIDNRATQ